MDVRQIAPDPGTARRFLYDIARKGGHDWAGIEWKLRNGHAQLWLAGDCAAIMTQMTVDDVFEVLLGAGARARDWVREAEAAIVPFGAVHGAAKTRIWGRKGWARLLPHWTIAGVDGRYVILELANEK